MVNRTNAGNERLTASDAKIDAPSRPNHMTKPRKFNYFIGVDVSRNKLDIAVQANDQLLFHQEIANLPESIMAFIIELKALPRFRMAGAVFCMETTGFYNNHLLECVRKKRGHASVLNAWHLKKSIGLVRAKTDKLDAMRIAQYAYLNRDTLVLWAPRRPVLQQLAFLNSLRNRMINLQRIVRTPINEQSSFIAKGLHNESVAMCAATIGAVRVDIERIDLKMDQLIAGDDRLRKLYAQVTSVPSVGRVMGIQFLISTNEFLDITEAKKFACYAGVAPFQQASGQFVRKARLSHMANKQVKALLHICALGAIRYDKELRAYFYKKRDEEGKMGVKVINAVRNKLIIRVFACVRQDRHFIKRTTEEAALEIYQGNSPVIGE